MDDLNLDDLPEIKDDTKPGEEEINLDDLPEMGGNATPAPPVDDDVRQRAQKENELAERGLVGKGKKYLGSQNGEDVFEYDAENAPAFVPQDDKGRAVYERVKSFNGGTLDHFDRPMRINRDEKGFVTGYSTTESTVVPELDGTFSVIPTMWRGEGGAIESAIDEEDAARHYRDTFKGKAGRKVGERFGNFATLEEAEAAAKDIHDLHQRAYQQKWNQWIHEHWDEMSDEIRNHPGMAEIHAAWEEAGRPGVRFGMKTDRDGEGDGAKEWLYGAKKKGEPLGALERLQMNLQQETGERYSKGAALGLTLAPFGTQAEAAHANQRTDARERLRSGDYANDEEARRGAEIAGLEGVYKDIERATAGGGAEAEGRRRELLSMAAEAALLDEIEAKNEAAQTIKDRPQTMWGKAVTGLITTAGYGNSFIYGSMIMPAFPLSGRALAWANTSGSAARYGTGIIGTARTVANEGLREGMKAIGRSAVKSAVTSIPITAVGTAERATGFANKSYEIDEYDRVKAIDDNYGTLASLAKGGAGSLVENLVVEGLTDEAINLGVGVATSLLGLAKIPGADKSIVSALRGIGGKATRKLMQNKFGRALLLVGKGYNKFSQVTNFESMPSEQFEEIIQPIFDDVLGLDKRKGERTQTFGEYADKMFTWQNQADIALGLVGYMLIQAGGGHVVGRYSAQGRQQAKDAREARQQLIDASADPAKVRLLSDEDAMSLANFYVRLSGNPDLLTQTAERLGNGADLIVDEMMSRVGAKMGGELRDLGGTPREFTIPTRQGADGRPEVAFQKQLVKDGATGEMHLRNVVADEESGVYIIDNDAKGTDRAYTVRNDNTGESADFMSIASARRCATLLINEQMLMEKRDEAKMNFIENLRAEQYGNANVEQYRTVAEAVEAGLAHGVDVTKDKGFRPDRRGWNITDKDGNRFTILVRDNIKSPWEVERVMRHENVGHSATANGVEFMDEALRGRNPIRSTYEDYRRANEERGLGMDDGRILREAVANTLQMRSHNPTRGERLIHGVRDWLRRHHVNLGMSNADMEVEVAKIEAEMRGFSGTSQIGPTYKNRTEFTPYEGEAEEGAADEAGNGADEAPAQPEQGEERGQEAPRPEAGAEPGAEAPDAGVVEPSKSDNGGQNPTAERPVPADSIGGGAGAKKPKGKRGHNLKGFSYEDYGAHPDDGGTGDVMGAALLRYAKENGGILAMPRKGDPDPLADWIDSFLDGNARKNRRGAFIALFGMSPRRGGNDTLTEGMPPELEVYLNRIIESRGIEAVPEMLLKAREDFAKWVGDKRRAQAEAKNAPQTADEGDVVSIAEIEARDAADAEYDNAYAEVERYEAGSPVIRNFSREQMRTLKRGDVLRFDHADTSWDVVGYDAENDVVTVVPRGAPDNPLLTDDEIAANMVQYRVSADGAQEVKPQKGTENGRKDERGAVEAVAGDAQGAPARTGGEAQGGGFRLESATAEQITAEEKKRREKAEIKKRQEAPLKGSGAVNVQPEMDLGQTGQQDLFSPIAEKPKSAAASAPSAEGTTTPSKSASAPQGGKSATKSLIWDSVTPERGRFLSGAITDPAHIKAIHELDREHDILEVVDPPNVNNFGTMYVDVIERKGGRIVASRYYVDSSYKGDAYHPVARGLQGGELSETKLQDWHFDALRGRRDEWLKNEEQDATAPTKPTPKSLAPKPAFKRGDRVFIKGAKDGQRVTFLKANADGTADVQVRTPGANRYAPEKVETRTVPMGEISSTGMKDTLTDAEKKRLEEGIKKQQTIVMPNAAAAKEVRDAFDAIDFDTPELSGDNGRFIEWAEKWKLDPSKKKYQREWAQKNNVDFDTPEFDPDKFGRLVTGVGNLVDKLTKYGYNDFKSLATYIYEQDAAKYGRAKPVLQDIWNAVARARGLARVSDAQADEVYAAIEKPQEAAPAPEAPKAPPANKLKETRISDAADEIAALITKGEKFTRKDVTDIVERQLGGKVANGDFDAKQVTDIMELAMNRVLNGRYSTSERGKRAFAPDGNASVARLKIQSIRGMLDNLPTQTTRSVEQDKMQQFSTPPTEAFAAAWVANITDKDVMLEPSAGIGGIAVFGANAGAKVVLNELSPRRAEILEQLGIGKPFEHNAENLYAFLEPEIKAGKLKRPTVVVMNPPFSNSQRTDKKNTHIGADHVEQALKLLAPGGRLVAIVGNGMAHDRPAFKAWWDRIGREYTVRANVGINGQEYAKYGTTFDNNIIVIDKVTPNGSITPIYGKIESLDELPALLEGVRNDRPTAKVDQSVQPAPREQGGSGSVAPNGRNAGPVATARPATGGNKNGGGRAGTPRRNGVRPVRPQGSDDAGVGAENNGVPDGRGDGRGLPDGDRLPNANGLDNQSNSAGGVQPALGGAADEGLTVQSVEQTREVGDGAFSEYRPSKISIPGMKPHPTALVESSAMASVQPPNPTYSPKIPKRIIEDGVLSEAQVEQVIYAGQAHEQKLGGGERKGYFIGDGTGVGKGREISGIILDNFNHERRKAVWISKTGGLANDAKRDLTPFGLAEELFTMEAKNLKNLDSRSHGVAFTTYASLAKDHERIDERGNVIASKQGKESRMQSLVKWLGRDFDGVIVFDESHLAGNAVPMKGKRGMTKPSAQALAVVDLQKALPNARILYVSATGATEVNNLAYATRLGLWGRGTAFKDRDSFITQVSNGGISVMEIVARDMKAMGVYMARTLSYEGIENERVTHELSPDQVKQYNLLAETWQMVMGEIESALISSNGIHGKANGNAKSAFWGAHQRFFNQTLTAMQMPSVLKKARELWEAGMSPVFQIVSTNEAAQNRAIQNSKEAGGEVDVENLDLSPRDILIGFVENSFPTVQYVEVETEGDGTKWVPLTDANGNPVHDPAAVERKERLIGRLQRMKMGEAPLDMILNEFGHENVAEVTGRSARREMVRNSDGEMEMRMVRRTKNNAKQEADEFNEGKRTVLVFSGAGNTGFSFHADRKFKNQRRRVQFMIEAGYNAAAAIQGLGRTHRANESSHPLYELCSTNLPGHKRFMSTIARRLAQLGSLTAGDRSSSGSGVFSEADNLENQYAKNAVLSIFEEMFMEDPAKFNRICTEMGFMKARINRETGEREYVNTLVNDEGEFDGADKLDIPHFLNRILAMKIDAQNELFDEFSRRMADDIERAKENGTFDPGMEKLKGITVEVKNRTRLWEDAQKIGSTDIVEVGVTKKSRKTDYAKAKSQLEYYAAAGAVPRVYTHNGSGDVLMMVETKQTKTMKDGSVVTLFRRLKPNGEADNTTETAVEKNYTQVLRDEEGVWTRAYEATPDLIEQSRFFANGTLLPIWDRLGATNPRFFKVAPTGGAETQTFLGMEIAPENVENVLARFGKSVGSVEVTPDVLLNRIMKDGRKVELQNGWTLKRVKVLGDNRIEIDGVDEDADVMRLAREPFAYSEKIGYLRVFVKPNAESLRDFLAEYPAVPDKGGLATASGTAQDLSGDKYKAPLRAYWSRIESATPAEATALGEQMRGFIVRLSSEQLGEIFGDYAALDNDSLSAAHVVRRMALDELVARGALDWRRRQQAESESRGGDIVNFDTPGIYTGTAADYANRSRQGGVDDGPSVKKIGTGEGSQVYGWGLYGSTVRGVAENYAKRGSGDVSVPNMYLDGKIMRSEDWERLVGDGDSYFKTARNIIGSRAGDIEAAIRDFDVLKKNGWISESAVRWIQANKDRISVDKNQSGNLYEQTFFTNRAEGDESHLLKWYEPVSETLQNRLLEAAVEEGNAQKSGKYFFFGANNMFEMGTKQTGEELYLMFRDMLGSPRAASEWLAAHGIDGVKYPVDSYGGKGVKDGDVAGWNYVSFRDDNIRVDHKWTDGVLQFDTPELSPVTPAEDAAYMDAVRRGDMETAQRMVREAAKKMPNVLLGDDGLPLVVYHGTNKDFTVFDKAKQKYDPGFFFAKNRTRPKNGWTEEYAEYYGGKVKAVFLTDATKLPRGEYRVEEPNQIKSADPVTYDDAGNVIPLSQRFNPQNEDIRFDTPELSPAEAEYAASEKRPIEDDQLIGFTKEDVAHSRRVLGMVPLTHTARTDAERHMMADALLSRSGYGQKLARAVANFGRPLFDYEQTALGKYRAQRLAAVNEAKLVADAMQTAYDALPKDAPVAESQKTLADLKAAKAELQTAMGLLDVADRADDKAGTEWGRSGRARQDTVKLPDMSWGGITRGVAQTFGGSEKIPQELMPMIEDAVKEYEKADEMQKKVVAAQFEKALDKAFSAAKNGAKIRRAVEHREGEEAKRAEKNYFEALAQFQVGAEETGGTLIGLADQRAPGWGKWLRYLAEYHCFMNPDIKVDECVAKMMEDLKECGMTAVDEVQVWEAWTGYGHSFRQSRFESQRRANWLKEQALHLAQLHHMDETNTMPEATGMIRDEDPTQEGRDLKKKVYDRKKEVPDAERDERHLKSIYDSIKRALDNRIADLKHAIETGERIPPRNRTVREDLEIRQKRKERDELQAVYDGMFGTTRTLTPEQRIAMAEKAMSKILERDLEDIARAEKGDFSKIEGHPTVNDRYVKTLETNLGKAHKTDSPALRAMREKHLENVKQMLALKKAKFEYGMTPEEIAAHNAKKLANLDKRIAHYAEIFTTGDLRRNVSRQPPMTPEQQKQFDEKEKQLKKAQRKLAELRLEALQATAPKWSRNLEEYGAFILAAQRALKTTIDFSSMFNQAAGMTISHPLKATRSFGKAWSAMWSDARMAAINDEIMSDPQIQEAIKKYGLHLREVDADNGRDVDMFKGMESQTVKLFGKRVAISDIPFYGKLMLASERHYITYLNAMSAELYVHIANGLNERFPGGMTPWMKKQLCDMINIWNGSGALTKEKRRAWQEGGISNFFFSLPLLTSQVQTIFWRDALRPLSQEGLKNEEGVAVPVTDAERKTMAKIGAFEHVKMAVATLALSALLRWIFADDDDRWQFDGANWFEKLIMAANPKIGNTTLDFTGGTATTYRLLYKIASGFFTGKVKTGSGRSVKYGGSFGTDASRLVSRFLEGRVAPWASTALSILNKKNFVGEPYGAWEAAKDMFVPMSLEDSYEQIDQNGFAPSLFTIPLTIAGVRAQTYDRKPYENAVNTFLEAEKEYGDYVTDGNLVEADRKAVLDEMKASNPLLADGVRDRLIVRRKGGNAGLIPNAQRAERQLKKLQADPNASKSDIAEAERLYHKTREDVMKFIRENRRKKPSGGSSGR